MTRFPDKKYNIIYADPPWTYKKSGGIKSSRGLAKKFYPTMELEDIKNLPIDSICENNCYLFMWCTAPTIPEALDVLYSWGFEYYTCVFTWIKKNKIADSLFWGMGNSSRANPEFILLGRKGKIPRVNADVHSVVEAKIQKHSKKPDEVRDRIVRLYGDIPRIELFAREKAEGWDSWGNEV